MNALLPLTKRQKEILDYIENSIKLNGYAPSLQEVRDQFKLKAVSTVHEHLENLKNKGYINKEMNQARGIQIRKKKSEKDSIKLSVKYCLRNLRLFPVNEKNEVIIVGRTLTGENENNYIAQVEDKCLEKKGILKGDYLIITEDDNEKEFGLGVYSIRKQLVVKSYSQQDSNFLKGKLLGLIRNRI